MYNDDYDGYGLPVCGACGLHEYEGVHCCDLAPDEPEYSGRINPRDALDAFATAARAIAALSADRAYVLAQVDRIADQIDQSKRAIGEFRELTPELMYATERRLAHMANDLAWLQRRIGSYDAVLADLAEDQRLAEQAFRDQLTVRPVR